MSVQEFIETRQAGLVDAFNGGAPALEDLLGFYADDGLDFSDFGNLSLHMDKPKLRKFFEGMLKACGNMKTSTASINGTKDLTVWEWNIEYNDIAHMPDEGNEKEWASRHADGRLVKMIGISLTRWNEDGKIVKNNDYGKVVKSFELVEKR